MASQFQKAMEAEQARKRANTQNMLGETVILGSDDMHQVLSFDGRDNEELVKYGKSKFGESTRFDRGREKGNLSYEAIESRLLGTSSLQLTNSKSTGISAEKTPFAVPGRSLQTMGDFKKSLGDYFYNNIIKKVEAYENKIARNRAAFLGIDFNTPPQEVKKKLIKFYEDGGIQVDKSKLNGSDVYQAILGEYVALEVSLRGVKDKQKQAAKLAEFQNKLGGILSDIEGILNSKINESPNLIMLYKTLRGTLLNVLYESRKEIFESTPAGGINRDISQVKSSGVTAAELLEIGSIYKKIGELSKQRIDVVSFEVKSVGSVLSKGYKDFLSKKGYNAPDDTNLDEYLREELEKDRNDTLKNILSKPLSTSGVEAGSSSTETTDKADIVVYATIAYNTNGIMNTINYKEKIDAKLGASSGVDDKGRKIDSSRYSSSGLSNSSISSLRSDVKGKPLGLSGEASIDNMLELILIDVTSRFLLDDFSPLVEIAETKEIENSETALLKSYVVFMQLVSSTFEEKFGIDDMENYMSGLIAIGNRYFYISDFLKLFHKNYFVNAKGGRRPSMKDVFSVSILNGFLQEAQNNKALDTNYKQVQFIKQKLFESIEKASVKTSIDFKDGVNRALDSIIR